jgi:hypothetical protein
VRGAPGLRQWGGVTVSAVRGGPSLDFELLWMVVAVVFAALWAGWRAGIVRAWACPLLTWTGLPCPTCRGTRCLVRMLAGDWSGAWALNPLVFCAAPAGALLTVYCLGALAGWWPRWRLVRLERWAAVMIRATVLLLVLAHWAYLIATQGNY